jgi:hypothetical protein
MANFTLTTGSDIITGTSTGDTVNGAEATLNSRDSLTGGAGTDNAGALWQRHLPGRSV